jgi:hypothetical protein
VQALDERAHLLDEAFLSSCFAYTKKASGDHIPELVHALQKILQLYAAKQLALCSPDGQSTEDTLLADVLAADEAQWDEMIEEMVQTGMHTFAWLRGGVFTPFAWLLLAHQCRHVNQTVTGWMQPRSCKPVTRQRLLGCN